ncbi:hypothetical protein V512_004735 [Mesotoga sp. Brook.08.105.5.1]|nr:hypothetical protein V512_004735 [Mesotoga sp. Brook.08.105.5.1]
MRRNAGEDSAGTQGCLRQEVMLALSRQEAEEHKKMNTTRILEARISR